MKKLFSFLTAAALLLSTSVFAAGNKDVNEKVHNAFLKNFSHATDVSWEAKDDFYFASFCVNETRFSAAYDEDGKLLATSRNLRLDQLPLAVTQALNEKYGRYRLGSIVTELVFENQTSYFILASNDRHVLRIKSDGNGFLTTESKTKI